MSRPRHIAGAMSGTSADGVDVAVVRIEGRGLDMRPHLVTHHHRPYPAHLRRQIFATRADGSAALASLALLAREIALTYAAAVNEALLAANLRSDDLTAVAAHGQTLFHDPPNTIQWLDPALLAAETGTTVVSDFRRADCAAGGQGAPLVPFADYVLFRHPTKNRILLNIGGIANLTWLPAGCAPEQLLAFDTGPGNCISDHFCRTLDPAGPGYDVGGAMAMTGTMCSPVAFAAARSGYTLRRPPKSTDGPEMVAAFKAVLDKLGGDVTHRLKSLPDILATACETTALSIHLSLEGFASAWRNGSEVFVSGGGAENQFLMARLTDVLTKDLPVTVHRIETLGLKSAAKEALAFALLAAATLDNIPSNLPSVTGAARPVLLGSITPRP